MLRPDLKMKKGFNTIQVIIVLLFSLIVVFAIISITSGKFRFFGNTAYGCESQGGRCVAEPQDCDDQRTNHECPPEEFCCMVIS